MSDTAFRERFAHLIDPREVESFDVMGSTIEFLTAPEKDDGVPCIMRGTKQPDVIVPLHSHPDPETFLMVAGEVEGLSQSADGFRWVRIGPGDVFHVPGGAKHALRNRSQEPAVMIVVSSSRLGRFLQEIGRPIAPGEEPSSPPSAETVRHFLETVERYGYWNATPEENAEVGLYLPPA